MMLGCQLACESIAGEKPQNQPPDRRRERRRTRWRESTMVPGHGGAGQAERHQHHEGDRRPEQQGHRHHRDTQRQHGRVGHQVDAVGVVELLGVERELAVQHHPYRVGEEELHLGRVAAVERGHPAGRVQPDPAGHPERGEQEDARRPPGRCRRPGPAPAPPTSARPGRLRRRRRRRVRPQAPASAAAVGRPARRPRPAASAGRGGLGRSGVGAGSTVRTRACGRGGAGRCGCSLSARAPPPPPGAARTGAGLGRRHSRRSLPERRNGPKAPVASLVVAVGRRPAQVPRRTSAYYVRFRQRRRGDRGRTGGSSPPARQGAHRPAGRAAGRHRVRPGRGPADRATCGSATTASTARSPVWPPRGNLAGDASATAAVTDAVRGWRSPVDDRAHLPSSGILFSGRGRRRPAGPGRRRRAR